MKIKTKYGYATFTHTGSTFTLVIPALFGDERLALTLEQARALHSTLSVSIPKMTAIRKLVESAIKETIKK